jgi:hypothetical protein
VVVHADKNTPSYHALGNVCDLQSSVKLGKKERKKEQGEPYNKKKSLESISWA